MHINIAFYFHVLNSEKFALECSFSEGNLFAFEAILSFRKNRISSEHIVQCSLQDRRALFLDGNDGKIYNITGSYRFPMFIDNGQRVGLIHCYRKI